MTTALTTRVFCFIQFSLSDIFYCVFPSSLHSGSLSFLPPVSLLLLTHTTSTQTPTQTQAIGGHRTVCSTVSSSLVRPGSLIKALNEATCIKHEALRAAVMNCCSIIASQNRKMKTKYLKRDSVTSLQMQH